MKSENGLRSLGLTTAVSITTLIIGGISPARGAEPAAPAESDTVENAGGLEEIVVTAQKREQSINTVGMSINALRGDELATRGALDTADLVKVVPGLTYQPSVQATPVYTLRGVGFYDASLSSSPAVSVYVDEVPLPFPVMTTAAALDVERVEVLKGPQGTLFGENSTGGAINYIAAKPTSTFAAGSNLSVGRFGRIDGEGYVSGPLSDTLEARLAVRSVSGGSWQYSITRPEDRLGNADRQEARLLLDWHPNDRLKVAVNLNGFMDGSDTLAFQETKILHAAPVDYAPSLAPADARAADWTAGWPMHSNNWMGQAAVRVDYQLNDSLTLSSLSSYAYENVDIFLDADATPYHSLDDNLYGHISTFNQELRLAGKSDRFNWIVGANYEHDSTDDNEWSNNTQSNSFTEIGVASLLEALQQEKIDNYAGFAHLEYELTEALSLQGGARYTDSRRTASSCFIDASPQNTAGQFFTFLEGLLAAPPVIPIGPGQCIALDPLTHKPVGVFHNSLDEDNVSWRFGPTYKFENGTLLYANASRGFKAGAIANIGASTTAQYAPIRQERVDAYEAGIKAPLMNRTLRFNAAAFYYKYFNKQVRGSFVDPIFGNLEQTVNVPQSRIVGGEIELDAAPAEGLNLSIGATYLDSDINGKFQNFNMEGTFANYRGSALPYTPKVQVVSDAQYEWAVSTSTKAFFGGGLSYHSATNATFAILAAPAPDLKIDSYALLDLRAGIASSSERWRVTFYGRNVTNKYYWTSAHAGVDTVYRTPADPATFGVTLMLRTH